MTWELTSGRFEDCVVNSVCDMINVGTSVGGLGRSMA